MIQDKSIFNRITFFFKYCVKVVSKILNIGFLFKILVQLPTELLKKRLKFISNTYFR